MTGRNIALSISEAANTGTQPPKEMRRDRAAMCDVGRRKDEICMARAVRERRMVRREPEGGRVALGSVREHRTCLFGRHAEGAADKRAWRALLMLVRWPSRSNALTSLTPDNHVLVDVPIEGSRPWDQLSKAAVMDWRYFLVGGVTASGNTAQRCAVRNGENPL